MEEHVHLTGQHEQTRGKWHHITNTINKKVMGSGKAGTLLECTELYICLDGIWEGGGGGGPPSVISVIRMTFKRSLLLALIEIQPKSGKRLNE